jgi:hypothetical protein
MNGELRRGATVRGVVSGSTEGAITTGGFSYDEATLMDLIREWLALGYDYDKSLRDSRDLTRVVGPGLDFASESVASAANSYGKNYLTYLQHNRDYCFEQAQLCQNALDDYLGVERRNVTELGRAGQSGDGDRPERGI